MKNLYKISALCLLILIFASCNDRLEGDEVTGTAALKIDSVKIPQDTMDVFSTQTIKTYGNYLSKCEGFYGYDYAHTGQFGREVAAYKFTTSANCGEAVTRSSQINFRPQETGIYTFRFWTGKDSSGQDTWSERQIVVQ